MKEINIRFKTVSQMEKENNSFPFIITIDGVEQKDIKRFYIELDSDKKNVESNSYTIEKFMRYPDEFRL